MSGNVNWSPEEDARLRHYVAQGQPWGAIAILMDATYATVYSRAQRLGLTPARGVVGRPVAQARKWPQLATSEDRLRWLYGPNFKAERAAKTQADLNAWHNLGRGQSAA